MLSLTSQSRRRPWQFGDPPGDFLPGGTNYTYTRTQALEHLPAVGWVGLFMLGAAVAALFGSRRR